MNFGTSGIPVGLYSGCSVCRTMVQSWRGAFARGIVEIQKGVCSCRESSCVCASCLGRQCARRFPAHGLGACGSPSNVRSVILRTAEIAPGWDSGGHCVPSFWGSGSGSPGKRAPPHASTLSSPRPLSALKSPHEPWLQLSNRCKTPPPRIQVAFTPATGGGEVSRGRLPINELWITDVGSHQ